MSVRSVLIALQASRRDGRGGRGVTSEEFLVPLDIQSAEVTATKADGGAWASGLVYLGVLRYSDFDNVDKSVDAGAQSEAFDVAVIQALQSAAEFLNRRSPQVIEAMRSAGLSVRLFMDVCMDEDQMQVEFPVELISACARHDLGIFVISNDF